MDAYRDELWIFLDVLIAAVLSGVVGWERGKFQKPAGIKTNMIVGSISCYFIANSKTLIDWVGGNEDYGHISSDPLRLIQAIVIGVSFIGAGTIIKSPEKNAVLFLTTAATLLYSAAVGMSVALQQYVLALGLSMLIVGLNWIINKLESKL